MDKGVREQRLSTGFGSLEYLLVLLMGLAPFCQFRRLPPIAGFWGEWVAGVLFSAWVLARRWRGADGAQRSEVLPWTAGAFLVLALLTLAQAAAGKSVFPSGAVLVAFELLLATLVCIEGAVSRRAGDAVRLLEAFAWGITLALLLNALSIALGHLEVDVPWIDLVSQPYQSREVGLIGQANHLGVLAVLAWAGFGYLHTRGRVGVVTYGLFAMVAGLVGAGSSSRTALVALAVALMISTLYGGHGRGVRARPTLVTGAVVFVAMQLVWSLGVEPEAANAPSVLRTSVSGRYEMLRDALLLGWHHPLWGVGFGNYTAGRVFELSGSLPYPGANHAHNLFGQLWAEWGGLGLLAVLAALAVLGWSLVGGWRRGNRSPEASLCITWLLALLAHSLVEFPLWSAYYLLPFAMMLGLVEQPELVLRPARPARRWAVGVVGVFVMSLCGLAAWDYQRSEQLATRVLAQIKRNPNGVAYISTAQAMRVAQLTLFPGSAEMMHARAMVLDTVLPDLKLEVARRALVTIASPETMSKYILLTAMSGRTDDARGFLHMLRRRSPGVAKETEKTMKLMAASNPILEAFVAAEAGSAKPAATASDRH